MRNRSGIQGVASSPIIVGAVTVLVVIVAVFLAYNANNGLPFVSTYDLKAQVPNADALVKGNEIRIGGARVGVVREVKPIELPAEECGVGTTSQELGAGCFAAELSLSLDQSAEPLPVDTTLMIRPKSPLGLKYVQLVPGESSQSFEAGDTIKIAAARPEPIDIDEFFSMFDEKTRLAVQRSQAGFGNSFAGRGPQINNAFAALRRVVEKAQPALRTIVAPETNFGGFWRALEDFSATLAPVAETQASMFVALDRTFAAFARVSRPYIQETISKSPPFLESATADLPALRPFFEDSARFFTALRPGTKALAETSPTIASALQTGVPVLNASPKFNAQLEPTVDALLAFQSAPGVLTGLDLLIDFNNTLNPAIKFIAPAQTVCNYLTLTFRNLADAFSETNGVANWVGAVGFEAPTGPNAEAGPAAAPANGPEVKNHLHYNPYPNTASPGQTEECEAGNERYKAGQTVIGNTPGNQGTVTAGQLKEGNG